MCRQYFCREKEKLVATSLPDSSTLLYTSKMSQKKQIFKLSILKKLLTDDNSCVSLVQSTRLLALPPFFLTDMKSGILYLLNSMLKKYDRSLGGIVIGYQNIKVLMDENTGIIPIGTSEMEVNISVEFYIFQPKIGNYLEGVINKKSNNHIGCLVHQYFNATILKPEDVLYEDWICKNFNVDDKIIFKVIDLDFTTLLPYIEGIYDGRVLLDKVESESSGNCDISNVIATNVNLDGEDKLMLTRKFLKGETNSDEIPDNEFLHSDKGESKCEVEVSTVDFTRNFEESQSFIDMGIKKKRKKKEKLSPSTFEEQSSNDGEIVMDITNKKLEDVKKRKKKRKRKEDENNDQEDFAEAKSVEKNDDSSLLPSHIHEKLLQVEDENSNDFVKFSKSKKEKKRKSQNEEPFSSFNKTKEDLPSQEVEDNVLYSTQLEPVIGLKKMWTSLYSPIPRITPFEDKEYDKTTTSAHPNNQDNVDLIEMEAKKKHKKRKREKQEEFPNSKKIKISINSSFKNEETIKDMNGREKKSLVQIMMEQLCQEQLNRVKEELNVSSSDKEERKKKEKKKKKREMEQSELDEVNKAKSQLNGDDRKSELQSTFRELLRQNLQKVKEEFNVYDKRSSTESKKKNVKVKKKEKKVLKEREESSKAKESKNAQINCTNGDEKVSILKIMMDELHKQQKNNEKEELIKSFNENMKEKKKKKSATNTQEPPREETFESLYEKLLNQAKNSMDLDEITVPILPPPAGSGKKKKESELSDVSTTSSRRKKNKHCKQKLEDCQQPPSKYKNGSMYDVVATPEKINPDKSLFSDSEQSHISPVKKMKGVNDVEAEQGKSKVQNMLDQFYKEELKRLKNESDREIQGLEKKSKKKSKIEEKCEIPNAKEESLYEKLLKEAKCLVHINEVSLPVKKERKEKKK